MLLLMLCTYLIRSESDRSNVGGSGYRLRRVSSEAVHSFSRWPTIRPALASVEEFLSKMLPTVGALAPACTPLIAGIMFGCNALALRYSPHSNDPQ